MAQMTGYATNVVTPVIQMLTTDTSWKSPMPYITYNVAADIQASQIVSVRITGVMNSTFSGTNIRINTGNNYISNGVPFDIDLTGANYWYQSARVDVYGNGTAGTITFSNVVVTITYLPAPILTLEKTATWVYPYSPPVTITVTSTIPCDSFEARLYPATTSGSQGQGILPIDITTKYPTDSNGVATLNPSTTSWTFEVTHEELLDKSSDYFGMKVWASSGGVWGSNTLSWIQLNFRPTLTLSTNKTTLEEGETATITVVSDTLCQRTEARGRYYNYPDRGSFIDLLGDDVAVDSNGVHTFPTRVKTWTFDVGYDELSGDYGLYEIGVWAEGVSYTGSTDDYWSSRETLAITKIPPISPVITLTSSDENGYFDVYYGTTGITVTVTSDIPCSAFEARAVEYDWEYGPMKPQGEGIDLIDDDLTVDANGIHTFATPQTTWTFDIAFSEIGTNGTYSLNVFAKSSEYNTWGSITKTLWLGYPPPDITIQWDKTTIRPGETITLTITADQTISQFSAYIWHDNGGNEIYHDLSTNIYPRNDPQYEYYHVFPTPVSTWQIQIPYYADMFPASDWYFDFAAKGTTYGTRWNSYEYFVVADPLPPTQPTYHSVGSIGYGTGSVTAGAPSGYAPGDLLILTIGGRDALPALPAGWTDISTRTNVSTFNRTCYRMATSSVSNQLIAGSGAYTIAAMYLIKNNNPYTPINAVGYSSSDGTSFTGGGVTTTTAPSLIVFATTFYDGGSNDTTNYSGWDNLKLGAIAKEIDNYRRSTTANAQGICVIFGKYSGIGETGMLTATADAAANRSATVTFAVAPRPSILYHELTITHKDTLGNVLFAPYSIFVAEGAEYSVVSQPITGYVPNIPVVSGTMGIEDVTVNVVYNRIGILTINYEYEDTSTAYTTYTGEVTQGETYSVVSPTITDYIPDIATVTGTMPITDTTITVTYSFDYRVTLTQDYHKINASQVATIGATTNYSAKAFEARATLDGQPYGRGIGVDVAQDDVTVVAGVHTFPTPVSSWNFDVAYPEIGNDGTYRITVYIQDTNGNWH